MLPHLFKIDERVFETLADGGHATQRRAFELFALEQRLAIFEQTNVIARNRLYQSLGRVQLTKCDSEMVGIVEGVEQILVERVDIREAWETVENRCNLLREGLGRVLDFTDVEGANTVDLETGTDLGWEAALRAG